MESLETASTTSEHSVKVPRKPTRPLKTYSKRSVSDGPSEPPLKRRRTDGTTRDTHQTELSHDSPQQGKGPCPSQSSLPPPPPPAQTSRNPKKGTILGYFKVVSPSSNNKSSSTEPSSCGAEPPSTPPSSPPSRTGSSKSRKRRRRLMTRIDPRDLEDAEEPNAANSPTTSDTDDPTQPPSKAAANLGALKDTSTNALNQAAAAQSDRRSEAGKRGKKSANANTKPKPKSAATVQTTLSLSLSDSGFAECKDCNMLYNPYHEKDAKLHARRHAAMVKAKEKEKRRGGDGFAAPV